MLEMATGGYGEVSERDANDEPPMEPKHWLVQSRKNPIIEDGLVVFGSSMREAELAKVDLKKAPWVSEMPS